MSASSINNLFDKLIDQMEASIAEANLTEKEYNLFLDKLCDYCKVQSCPPMGPEEPSVNDFIDQRRHNTRGYTGSILSAVKAYCRDNDIPLSKRAAFIRELQPMLPPKDFNAEWPLDDYMSLDGYASLLERKLSGAGRRRLNGKG